ncbi:S-2-hydroxy-acid oxidase [Massarina eburnea CBS 473.64]|uniref:Oxidase FUB9 n=1 Tax=Massarina eburnea CBS 473.64 TaxID=1395130 RepID=A0A6A6RY48_9PLEO|nr:S-2-hydroxy-acid oxidase [Massarina eburnea CBS 473.64]
MILSISDLQVAASAKLPSSARDFYNSGSTDQITVHENTTAYKKYRLRPRVLRNVSLATPQTTLFSQQIAFPLCVSPAGIQAIAHPTGELATSRACAKRNIHMGISSFANHSVEDIVEAAKPIAPIAHVMQLYTMKDRAKQLRIIQRAEKAGCRAIFLTADSPVLGIRYNEHRNDFRTPTGLDFPMLEKTSAQIRAETHDDQFKAFNADDHSWAREIPWLRSVSKMEIWIKGVLTAEDVILAREFGCDGVIVSNHGGRQLDGTPATIDVLQECAEAGAGKIRVHVDGGIRSGSDIFKAIALGAECCWIGRPVLWGLAYDGEAGVTKALDILYDEFKRCMQLTGCNSVSDITKASLGVMRAHGPLARL